MFRLILLIGALVFAPPAFSAIVVGNPHGSVTLVEVFDYQCPICHKQFPIVEKIIANNGDLKVRLMPTAIINKLSIYQAAAAISAADYKNKFREFTKITLTSPIMNEQQITATLRQLGLTSESFHRSMHSKKVKDQFMEGLKLLKAGKSGTPLFIIYPTSNPRNAVMLKGYRTEKVLQKVIDYERHAS